VAKIHDPECLIPGESLRVRRPGGTTHIIPPSVDSQPSITGSRGGNAALASLITQLAAQGILIDNTTA
jgi:hypothetical protein